MLSLSYAPGASTGDPTHDKVMQKSLTGKADQDSKGSPGSARASTPKPESVCLLFAILYSSDVNGGLRGILVSMTTKPLNLN